MTTSDRITIMEVGPRDGLQNESQPVRTAVKQELVERLVNAGTTRMELTSFVRADRIPQLADADVVARHFASTHGLRSVALVPNLRGLDAAIAAGIKEIAVFGTPSETFSQRNINCSVAESLERFRGVADRALEHGVLVRGYVSTVMGCPYEGDVPFEAVTRFVEALFAMGCHEVSVADTIGVGRPERVRALVRQLADAVPVERLAFHGHDTYGMGLANALAALDEGVRTIDTSIGGLGGCPFAGPRAKGNLATEDLVYALDGPHGSSTGLDLAALVDTAWWICAELGRPPASSVAIAMRRDD